MENKILELYEKIFTNDDVSEIGERFLKYFRESRYLPEFSTQGILKQFLEIDTTGKNKDIIDVLSYLIKDIEDFGIAVDSVEYYEKTGKHMQMKQHNYLQENLEFDEKFVEEFKNNYDELLKSKDEIHNLQFNVGDIVLIKLENSYVKLKIKEIRGIKLTLTNSTYLNKTWCLLHWRSIERKATKEEVKEYFLIEKEYLEIQEELLPLTNRVKELELRQRELEKVYKLY